MAKFATAKTAPLSYMRVVGVGLSMYTADYNDLYAPNFSSANDFKGVLLPDLKSNQYFDSFNPKRSVLLPSNFL